MIVRDFIPGEEMKNLKANSKPNGFDYWKPEWKLINGKIVKEEKVSRETEENIKEESETIYKCDFCDFKTKHLNAIKIHVSRFHKDKTKKD